MIRCDTEDRSNDSENFRPQTFERECTVTFALAETAGASHLHFPRTMSVYCF